MSNEYANSIARLCDLGSILGSILGTWHLSLISNGGSQVSGDACMGWVGTWGRGARRQEST